MPAAAKKIKNSETIPNKLYFKIGEVADIVGVKPYVLRYWETEFPDIAPSKSKSKQRLYKRKEVELILKIRDLLYKEKFTIEGARKRLKGGGKRAKNNHGPQEKQITLPLGANANSRDMLRALKKKLLVLEKVLGK